MKETSISDHQELKNKKGGLFNNLASQRKQRKNSLLQVARKIGVSKEALCQFEKGLINPSLPTALKIARYYNKPVEEIFWLAPEKNSTITKKLSNDPMIKNTINHIVAFCRDEIYREIQQQREAYETAEL